MDFLELIRKRHSIRRFQERDVEEETLRELLEAARLAPSAGDLQAYRVCVVRDTIKKRELVWAALGQEFVAQAPVVLVFCQDAERSAQKYGRRGAELYSLQDATIACAYAQLAAASLGLGSCWVGAFDEGGVARALGLPARLRPVALLLVGYPAEEPYATPRRAPADLLWPGPG